MTRARLVSGIILYVYVATHLINHALGIVSLEAMETGREIFLAVWRNPVGSLVLYGALLTHLVLVLWSLYARRTVLRMPVREVFQVLFGLALPTILMEHMIGTRGMSLMADVNDTYAYVLATLWISQPATGALQSLMLVLAWAHGTMGLYFWLRLKPWFPRVAPWIYTVVVVLPVVALIGFADAGRELVRLLEDDEAAERIFEAINYPPDEAIATAIAVLNWSLVAYAGLIGLVLVGRTVRWAIQLRATMVTITYPDGRTIAVEPGTSILDASRRLGYAHASVCGGRGRCSTCRIHVSEGRDDLPPLTPAETRVLSRVGASDATRLACQLKPTTDLSVTPLLAADATVRDGYRQSSISQGAEKEVAILFADIRAFTSFSEKKLPYDVVFVLNQYFKTMGSAVEQAGGQLDKFIGDGVMALFGIETSPEDGCRAALRAARQMARGLNQLNDNLKSDLPEPLRIGIGIHVGSVIVGDMGYAKARSVTAIGDAVNTASRLEALNKELGSQLVISTDVAKRAGYETSAFTEQEVSIRGREGAMRVLVSNDTAAMEELVPA